MIKITGLSHLFKWENLQNWWLTKYFFAPLYTMGKRKQQVSRGWGMKEKVAGEWGTRDGDKR